MNSTLNDAPKQLDFTSIQDPRPVPLIVSEKWDFPLQYHIIDSICYFSVIDWIAGIGTSDNVGASKIWTYMQQNQTAISTRSLPYKAKDGKTYQRDFASDTSLYDIAQNMRATKDRPALKAIQDYLSQAGSLLDQWRREPEKMLSAAMSRMQADIDRHEKAGLGDRVEIVHLRAEFEAKQLVKQLNGLVAQVVDNPDYAKIHNTKHLALFGATAAQIRLILNSKDIHKALPTLQLNTLIFAERQIIEVLRLQGGKIDNQRALNSIILAVKPLGIYLQGLCDSLGIDVITGKPAFSSKN